MIAAGGDIPAAFKPERGGFEYAKNEVMIPMRDGVRLHTVIVIPKGVVHGPMLLDRTPYDADKLTKRGDGGALLASIFRPTYAALGRAGYIIVAQDVRGKHHSEGDYVMNRPIRGTLNPTAVDHSTDAYDTIDWLIHNVPESNGRVGTIGTSYDGFTALMSLIGSHPALKASVPINPMVDVWKGDDWFHNGAFRQEMMSYIYGQTASKDSSEDWVPTRYDDYDSFLAFGSADAFGDAKGMGQLPFWTRLTSHPSYDPFWQGQAVDVLLAATPPTVPTLLVASQWDQEDIYGAMAVYRALREKARGHLHLVIGPWHHGQSNIDGSGLGQLDWGSDTSAWFREHILIPFLDAHLKGGAKSAGLATVTAFETGSNTWRQLTDWPDPCSRDCASKGSSLFLASGGVLSSARPGGSSSFDEYISDPAKPVTYRPRPMISPYAPGSTWKQWLVDDQRFASVRPDVLVYQTPPLDHDVTLAGQPVAHLYASTTGTDADWVVKLIDVYPDLVPEKPEMGGFQLAVAMDILRGRYREDASHPKAIPPGKVIEYDLKLPDVAHRFKAGHRIMVQVQSSWFPLYDRNPQTYVPNIFFARPADYRKASQRIYHSPTAASYVSLPIDPQ